MKAFVCRLGPRLSAKGQTRGTVIDPTDPESPDQLMYFDRTVMQGSLPDDITVEFGQPPKRKNVHLLEVGDVIVLLLGATDFRGSANKRGIMGIGRVQSLDYAGSGPSERCRMKVSRIVSFNPVVDLDQLQGMEWFAASKLYAVPAFGFNGKIPAQNILKCFDDGWSEEQTATQIKAILGTLQGADPTFSSRLHAKDEALSAMIPDVDPDWVPEVVRSETGPAKRRSSPPPQTVEELAARLYLPIKSVEEMLWILEKKQSLILSGPPGVGKTYIAREISQYMFGANFDFVQFHPSYSYEYFVSGYRPSTKDNNLTYVLSAGPLLDILHAAESEEADVPFGLIIDEINRSNVSSVFGELLTALEYRGIPVRLQYGSPLDDRGEFVVPENFYIVATMNRADRSAGNFDSALRRRFGFFECYPTQEPFKSVLGLYLASNHPEQLWVADWIHELNDLVPDPDFAIGASFFMGGPTLDDPEIDKIMRFELAPYLRGKFGDNTSFDFLLKLGVSAARDRYINSDQQMAPDTSENVMEHETTA